MDPSDPLHLTEEERGKGLETRSFQDPSKYRPRSASEAMPNRSGIMKPGESSETATQGSMIDSLTSPGDPTTIRPQSCPDEIGPAFPSFRGWSHGPFPSPPPSRHNSGEQHPNDLPSTTSASGLQPSHWQKPLSPVMRHHRHASSGFRSRGTQPLTSVGISRMSPYPTPTASPQVIPAKLEDPNDQNLGAGLGMISGLGRRVRYPQAAGRNAFNQASRGGYQSVHSISGGDQDPVAKQNVTTGRTANKSIWRRKQAAPFVCKVPGCGRGFMRAFNLKRHRRSHYEQKPYKCH